MVTDAGNGHPGARTTDSLWADLDSANDKTRRSAARQLIGVYHEEQLAQLLGHVRSGLARLDAGDIDVFELDELIHRYHRCAQKLWSFCGSSGGHWLQAAQTIRHLRETGEEPDWWAAGAPQQKE